MDIRKVKKLIELLEESGIAEIEISEGEESVRISRYSTTAQPTPTIVQDTVPRAAPVATVRASETSATTGTSKRGHEITAPMVGTFYAGSAPGSKPFVQIGSKVAIGDTLCIVEAMKMENEVRADSGSVVTCVHVREGEAVEKDQILVDLGPLEDSRD